MNNLTHDTEAICVLDTENYDPNSNFNVGTYTYTTPIAGYYQINAQISYSVTDMVANKNYFVKIKSGAGNVVNKEMQSAYANRLMPGVADCQYLAKGAAITLYAESESGTNTVDIDDGNDLTFMSIHFVGI